MIPIFLSYKISKIKYSKSYIIISPLLPLYVYIQKFIKNQRGTFVYYYYIEEDFGQKFECENLRIVSAFSSRWSAATSSIFINCQIRQMKTFFVPIFLKSQFSPKDRERESK